MTARVSLALPVHNGAKYLEEALRSLVGQTYSDFELIITDNASTDATQEICESFALGDDRIAYCRLPKNIGAGPNFNLAFGGAHGEFFKWCAHDDLISPNFVERCVATLESRSDAALAYGRTQCIDEKGAFIHWTDSGFMPSIESDSPIERFRLAIASAGTCFPVFGLFRTEALRRTSLHRPYYGSDRALIAEIALLGKAILVDDAVLYNREHGTRSINLADQADRLRWHCATNRRWQSMEHVNLLTHLLEIACRHGDVARPSAALLEVARASLTPRQLGRYALDVARLVTPSGGAKLRRAWASTFAPNVPLRPR
jgi:glycosyltransferase involved in cell wall biosynthesis